MNKERDTMYFVAILLGKANHSQGEQGNCLIDFDITGNGKYSVSAESGFEFTGTLEEIEAWLDGFLTARGELP